MNVVCRRVAVVRRQVRKLAAIAAERAAATSASVESVGATPSFLAEAETESILGDELLAALAARAGVLSS
jgi:hypothetical protein